MNLEETAVTNSTLDLYTTEAVAIYTNESIFLLDAEGNILQQKGALHLENTENLIASFNPYLSQLLDATKVIEEVFFDEEAHKWYRCLINPINAKGIRNFIVKLLDITIEKEIENQLIRHKKNIEGEMLLRTREIILTNKVMSGDDGFLQNFLRGLRHDLLSPITQLKEIITYYKKADNPSKKEKASGLIDDCLRKLTNTSEGFSNFVDLHFIPQADIENVSYQSIYDSVHTLLENEIKEANANIALDFKVTHQDQFSKLELGSIFYNLLSNAIKFRSTTRPLNIELRTFQEKENTIFEIQDNGVGIDLEQFKHKLFQPFTKINMEQEGAGIGLSLVKNVLEIRERGTIKMESIQTGGVVVQVVFASA